MAKKPRPRQLERKQGGLPDLRMDQAKVIMDNRILANKPVTRLECDCACALI